MGSGAWAGWRAWASAVVVVVSLGCGPGRPPPECETDRECDDGVACNGTEACQHGFCASGSPVGCDDGIPCTVDECTDTGCQHAPGDWRCDDEIECTDDICGAEGCMHEPNDALCGDEVCTELGCMPECTVEPCDPVRGCGCGADKCGLSTSNQPTCVPWPDDPASANEPCVETNDCGLGMVCVDVGTPDTGSHGLCHTICRSDSDCGPYPGAAETGVCFTFDGSSYGYCTSGCDPLDSSSSCPAGTGCRVFETPDGTDYAGQCLAPDGDGTFLDPCEDSTDCEEAYLCVRFSDGPACVELCDEEDDDCPGLQECRGVADLQGAGYCGDAT